MCSIVVNMTGSHQRRNDDIPQTVSLEIIVANRRPSPQTQKGRMVAQAAAPLYTHDSIFEQRKVEDSLENLSLDSLMVGSKLL